MDEGHSPARRRLFGLVLFFLLLVAGGTFWLHFAEDTDRPFAENLYRILMLFTINGEWVFQENSGPVIRALAFLAPVFTVLTIVELVTRNFIYRLVLSWQLRWMKDHFIIAGLTEESLLVAKSLNEHPDGLGVVVIDADPPASLWAHCRRFGIPVVVGSPADPLVLASTNVRFASSVISFLPDAAEAIRLILSTNSMFGSRTARKPSGEKGGVNVWIKLGDTSFGLRLGEYLKLPDVASYVQPRFFSLDEVAARRLIRFHAPDIYADAFDQERVHLAIYGFNRLAVEIIKEVMVQSISRRPLSPRFTVLTEDREAAEATLLAQLPQLSTLTDLNIQELQSHATGVADSDYGVIPEDVTMHVVCYESPEKATSTGLSLRRLSLAAPGNWAGDTNRRLNAPIFVRLAQMKGIAQFLGSSTHASEESDTPLLYRDRDIPDGIFAFGMVEDLLSADDLDAFVPTIIDTPREEIAKQIHFSYLLDREAMSSRYGGSAGFQRRAELKWSQLAPEYRESCRQGADHIWTKARIINCRIVRQEPAAGNNAAKPVDLSVSDAERQELAIIEHRRWYNERTLSGWTFNKKRVDFARTHDLLRPWGDIPEADARLDLAMPERIQSGLAGIGLDLKRELVVGVIGHRNRPDLFVETDFVRDRLRKKLVGLQEANPDKSLVILTPLAEGADSIAAEIAIELGLPYNVPLPLPFEAYRQDFESGGASTGGYSGALSRFLNLAGKAERYLEMPLKFGDLISVSLPADSDEVPLERMKQYALAAAYIVERADELIAIWDGQPPKGIGGTGEAVAWRAAGKVPAEFASDPAFSSRPVMKPPIIISPSPDEA